MAFTLTDEQRQLQESARDLLRDAFPLERLANTASSIEDWDPASWRELAELGWLGVTVPEEHDGAGLGFVELAILVEQLGYNLYSGPFFSTTVLALPALAPEEQARVANGEARWSAEVDGLVPDFDRVDCVVTAEGAALAVGELLDTIDPSRPLGRLSPGARTPLAGDVDLTRAYAGAAAEAVGVAQCALDQAVAYVKERWQFGRPIGGYQAVSHPLADTFADVELARSLAYAAAWRIDEEPDSALPAASAAKAFATEAAVRSCERAIQVHGGMGFTWEHPLHRFYKRALWLQAFGGYPAEHRARVVRHVLASHG